MIRLWLLMWHFVHFEHYKNPVKKTVDRLVFVFFYVLNKKLLCEDWRDSLLRIKPKLFPRTIPTSTDPILQERLRVRGEKINDLIEKAKQLGYLEESGGGVEVYLNTNWKGRAFLRPLTFLGAVAREHKDLGGVVGLIVGSSVFTLLIQYLIQ